GLAEPMLHPISWSVALPYYLVALFFGYLVGSIPFGLIFTRLAGTADIRTLGSGNIGATNVLRTGHRGLAAATLMADIFKGTAAPAVTWLTDDPRGVQPFGLLAVLVVIVHRSNIRRLLAGTEGRTGGAP